MTAYTVIPDADINPDKPIKSATAYALRNNPIAIAEGDSTAPSINPAALLIGGKGGDGVLNNAAALTGMGFYEFSSMAVSAAKNLPLVSILRIAGDCTLSAAMTVAARSLTVATNSAEILQASNYLGARFGLDGEVDANVGAGGGSIGSGAIAGAAAGGVGISVSSLYRPWAQRTPILGGNGGLTGGGGGGLEWGPGGGSIIIIIEGNFDATGGTISATGGNTNDLGPGGNNPGGGGGGSVVVICTGTITNGTFTAAGGAANSGGFGSGGGGGGGWVQLVAAGYSGTQTLSAAGGASNGTAGSAGYTNALTLTRDQIRTLLQRL